MGGLAPGALLVLRAWRGELGANPIEQALNGFGELAIKLLLLCLSCTPLRILTGSPWPMLARRHLGLLAFTYACAHLFVYAGVDRAGEIDTIVSDVLERPFIIVGLAAFTLLVPLAATSSKRMVKRLGGRRWQALHRLVYVVATLAIVHFVMRAKKDTTEALLHGAFLASLFAVRIGDQLRRKRARDPATRPLRGSLPRGPS